MANAEPFVRGLLKRSQIVVFSKSYSPEGKICEKILQHYQRYLKDDLYLWANIEKRSDCPQVEDYLWLLSGKNNREVPLLFVNQRCVGGYNEILKLHNEGKLVKLLTQFTLGPDWDEDSLVDEDKEKSQIIVALEEITRADVIVKVSDLDNVSPENGLDYAFNDAFMPTTIELIEMFQDAQNEKQWRLEMFERAVKEREMLLEMTREAKDATQSESVERLRSATEKSSGSKISLKLVKEKKSGSVISLKSAKETGSGSATSLKLSKGSETSQKSAKKMGSDSVEDQEAINEKSADAGPIQQIAYEKLEASQEEVEEKLTQSEMLKEATGERESGSLITLVKNLPDVKPEVLRLGSRSKMEENASAIISTLTSAYIMKRAS